MDKDIEMFALILDTSAFIAGYGAPESTEALYTVPAVKNEVKEGTLNRLRIENALKAGVLKMVYPEEKYIDEVLRVLVKLGENRILSDADIQIVALGIQLKDRGITPIIVSDDYAVQNLADKLKLSFKSLVTPGIKRRYRWMDTRVVA